MAPVHERAHNTGAAGLSRGAAGALPALVGLYGVAFAAPVMLMRNPNTLIDVSGFLVSGLSGGIFPANVPPGFLLPISVAILLTYGYDAVRGYLLHTGALLPIRVEMRILLCSMAVFVPLGYVFSGSPSSAAANWARWVCTSVHDAVPDLLPPTSLIRGRDGS